MRNRDAHGSEPVCSVMNADILVAKLFIAMTKISKDYPTLSSVCRKCAAGPHHGPCGTFAYHLKIIGMVILSMFLSTFLVDVYVYLGFMKVEE